jgi:acetyl esterase/lipase
MSLPGPLRRAVRTLRFAATLLAAAYAADSARTFARLRRGSLVRGFVFDQGKGVGALVKRALIDTAVNWVVALGEVAIALSNPELARNVISAYFGFSGRVLRNIPYGSGRSGAVSAFVSTDAEAHPQHTRRSRHHPLQTMDVYLPRASSRPSPSSTPSSSPRPPVIVLVHGGAWAWGAAAEYAAMSRTLADAVGAAVAAIDYRAYPHGSADDMALDVLEAVARARECAEEWGCDGRRVYLLGHSAGSHLIALALMRAAQAVAGDADADAMRKGKSVGGADTPSGPSSAPAPFPIPLSLARAALSCTRAAILVSGVFHIGDHYDHEDSRVVSMLGGTLVQKGVARISPMAPAMCGRPGFASRSPSLLLGELSGQALGLLPRMTLVHGTEDTTAPVEGSRKFVRAYAAAVDRTGMSAGSSVRVQEAGEAAGEGIRPAGQEAVDTGVQGSPSIPVRGVRYVEVEGMNHADVIFDMMTGGALAATRSFVGEAGGRIEAGEGEGRSGPAFLPAPQADPSSSSSSPYVAHHPHPIPTRWSDPLMAAVLHALSEGEEGEGSDTGAAAEAQSTALEKGGRQRQGQKAGTAAGAGRPHLVGERAAAEMDG